MFQQKFFNFLIVYAWAFILLVDPYRLDGQQLGFSFLYIATVGPTAAFILLNFPSYLRRNNGKDVVSLLIFIIIVVVISLLRGDFGTIVTIGSLCLMLIVLKNTGVTVSLKLVNTLYLITICASIIMQSLGIGRYGILPGHSIAVQDSDTFWVVSLFPFNVTPSWLFSGIVLGVNYFFNPKRSKFLFIFTSGYFLLLSGSRTGLIILIISAFFLWCTTRVKFRKRMFYKVFIPCIALIFIAMLNAQNFLVYFSSLNIPFLNSFVFKSVSSATDVDQINSTIVRTFIWGAHMDIFAKNPLMGHGSFVFYQLYPNFPGNGSEAFLTGLFARVGLSALMFIYFMYFVSITAARNNDKFLYCLMIFFAISSLSYGSYIVPYDFIFLLLFGLVNFSRSRSYATSVHKKID